MSFLDKLKWNAEGLIPAIIQDRASGRVLMMAWMNRASLEKTLETRRTFFWSRSRQKFWLKGETSGMFLQVRSVRVNCENNSLLILAEPIGPTCHTGHESCYYREAQESGGSGEWVEIAPVLTDPEALYGKK